MQLTEGSDAAISSSISLPGNAASLTFDYHFTMPGIGDRLVARINGTEIWSLLGTDDTSTEMQSTGAIDISPFAGQVVELEIRLSTMDPSTGEGKSQVWVDNVAISEESIESIDVQVGGSLGNSIVYTDSDGTTAMIQLKGGAGTARFTGDNLAFVQNKKVITVTGDNLTMSHLQVDGAAAANLQVKAKGGDGRVTWGGLTIDGSASAINAAIVDFNGDVVIAGWVQSLTLGNITGNHLISLGGLATDKASRVTLGNLVDMALVSTAPIQLTAVSWTDTDPNTNPDSLTAPYATTLTAKGDTKNNIPGHWAADVNLSGVGATKETLKTFKALSLSDSVFDVVGAIGTFDVSKGTVDGFTLNVVGDAKTIKLGDVSDSSLTAQNIATLQAFRMIGGQITADTLKTLKVVGDKKTAIAGDMNASLTINGDTAATSVLGSATIAGALTGVWQVNGPVGSITALGLVSEFELMIEGDAKTIKLGDVSNSSLTAQDIATLQAFRMIGGQITADTIKTFKITGDKKTAIAGDMNASLTINGDPAAKTVLGTATIVGLLGGQWQVEGPVGSITVGDVDAFTGNVVGAVSAFSSKAAFSGLLAAFSFAKIDIKTNMIDAKFIAGGDSASSFINSLKIGGNMTNSSIFVGVDAINGIFGDEDDLLLGGASHLIKSLTIGGVTDTGNPMFFAGLFPQTATINKVKVDPLMDPRFLVTPI